MENNRQEYPEAAQQDLNSGIEDHYSESEEPQVGLPTPVEYDREDIISLNLLERLLNRILVLVGSVGVFAIVWTAFAGAETLHWVMTGLIAPVLGIAALLVKGVLGRPRGRTSAKSIPRDRYRRPRD
jgi:hypothetical protein